MLSATRQFKPLFEPLSRATATAMQPAKLAETDYLEIDLDKDGKRFDVRAIGRRPRIAGEGGKFFAVTPSTAAVKQWVRKIPEARPHQDQQLGHYICAATDFTALVIAHAWPKEKLIFKSDLARILYAHLIARFLSQTKVAQLIAHFKVNKTLPDLPQDWCEREDKPLAPYQRLGVLASLGNDAFALCMKQGTGKTPIVVTRCNIEGKRCRAGQMGAPHMMNVLVIAPTQVCYNWQNEFVRFSTLRGKAIVCQGDVFARARGLIDASKDDGESMFSAAIMPYDSAEGSWEWLRLMPWDLIVWDESHKAKSSKTDRWKMMAKLRDLALRHMFLTGTPIANWIGDIWAQLELLGEGLSGFATYENFKNFHAETIQTPDGFTKLIGTKNIPMLKERLSRLCLFITKDEAGLNLPPKVYDVWAIEMTPKQAHFYREMKRQLAIEIADDIRKGEEKGTNKRVTAEIALTKLLRLTQITSGFLKYDDDRNEDTGELITKGAVEQIPGKNPKLEAVVEILKDDEEGNPDGKRIIWCNFREDIRVISERLTAEGIGHRVFHGSMNMKTKEQMINDFNHDPSVKAFVVSLSCGSEGLNLLGYDWDGTPPKLTTYTDHCLFVSINWSLIQRDQAEDRAHRRGMRAQEIIDKIKDQAERRGLRITDIMVPGSIDEEIRKRVVLKRQNAEIVSDLADILKAVLEDG